MGSDANWRSFAVYLTAGAAALALGTLATAYIIDPFDTGRSTWFEKPGVRPQGPRTAGASRGRDLSFNAGIFGNSPDSLPLVGQVPGRENAWLSRGYSGHGNVLGLACGRLVARAILGRREPELELFDPARLTAS